MSVRTLAAVADLSDTPPTCKLVLYGLAIEADGIGMVAVSYERMMQRTGLSERSIRGTLRTLEKLELLDRSGNTAGCYQIRV